MERTASKKDPITKAVYSKATLYSDYCRKHFHKVRNQPNINWNIFLNIVYISGFKLISWRCIFSNPIFWIPWKAWSNFFNENKVPILWIPHKGCPGLENKQAPDSGRYLVYFPQHQSFCNWSWVIRFRKGNMLKTCIEITFIIQIKMVSYMKMIF